MKRVIDRFDAYMTSMGLNDNKVTVQLNLTNGLIGKSRKPGRDLSRSVVEKILAYYTDLNPVWLRTGEGEMLTTSSRDSKPELVAEYKPQLSNVEILLREMLAEERARVDALQERINELIEENARLKTLIEGERKGGVA